MVAHSAGSLKTIGMIILTLTLSPRCLPGIHGGEFFTALKASLSIPAPIPCTTNTSVISLSFPTTNQTNTFPS